MTTLRYSTWLILCFALIISGNAYSSEKPLIPYQDFNEEDMERFPPELMREIREKEQYWGEVLLEHRKQYEDYYKNTLGPGIHSTWDVYKKEKELMSQPSHQQFQAPVVERKTLKRFPDRVWISSGQFIELEGKKIQNLRLHCYRFGRLHVIPFDIDEGTEEGEKILTHGPENNAHLADGMFNNTDQLVFMTHDTGDKIEPGFIKEHYGEEVIPVEIEITDPKTNEKGWVYLTYFPQNPPPRSAFDYITFLNDTVNQQFTDYVWHQGMIAFHKDDVYRRIFTRSWKYAPFYGYTGEDLVDRMKNRITARLCFGLIKVHIDEDDAVGNWLAWKDGQVLATGRAWIGVKLPMGLKSPRLTLDVIATDTMMSVPIKVHVPINPGVLLTDYTMKIGTDWHMGHPEPGVDHKNRFFNSNNRDGAVVDGVMSEEEKNWNRAKDKWRILTGPGGTIAFRSYWDSYYEEQAEIWVDYIDDASKPDPPEFYPGQWAMHYGNSRIKSLEPRDYMITLEFFGPPEFWNPDPEKLDWKFFSQYLEILDHPIEFKIGDTTGKNAFPALKYSVDGIQ